LSKKTRMMGAEPGRPNELSPITRIDTARVRPVQSAAGRSFIEPGSPWQNPFVESFGSRVRDEVLSGRSSTLQPDRGTKWGAPAGFCTVRPKQSRLENR
jgi:hypothetical protein